MGCSSGGGTSAPPGCIHVLTATNSLHLHPPHPNNSQSGVKNDSFVQICVISLLNKCALLDIIALDRRAEAFDWGFTSRLICLGADGISTRTISDFRGPSGLGGCGTLLDSIMELQPELLQL